MKKVTYTCNICSETEEDEKERDAKFYGIEFDTDNSITRRSVDIASIHICAVCIKAISDFKENINPTK